ncbi:hypothetical protein H6P81_012867 [Aristolochia fimbriata]|uniref:F-box protein FBW2 n=1 Tax=Aristolochia fimbriata TaxID=158543 RepID=A0AAV7EEL8_ARIFI|nr:hypothetical protein H6P81_012867 [Aristolochia fimbriata]
MAKKRPRLSREGSVVAVDVDRSGGPWDALSSELVGEIASHLPGDEVARSVAFVCKSWAEAVAGPYCWSVIDINKWCRRCDRFDVINFVVRKLIRRAGAAVRRLAVFKLDDSALSFVASCGKFLKVLNTPMGEISDVMVEKYAGAFTALTVLDISFCLKITSKGIETIGRQCRCLVHLKRNMPMPPYDHDRQDRVASVDESEALAIAGAMPGLSYLGVAYGRFSDYGLHAIITNCKDLVYLDIEGCMNLKMDNGMEEECERIKFLMGPWVDYVYEMRQSEVKQVKEKDHFEDDRGDGEVDQFEEWIWDEAHPLQNGGADLENAIDIFSDDVIEIPSDDSDS